MPTKTIIGRNTKGDGYEIKEILLNPNRRILCDQEVNMLSTPENYERDLQLFQEFLKAWQEGTFTSSSPVYGLIQNQALLLCERFNLQNEVDDLIQTGLIGLSRGQYRGNCPLDAYIHAVLKNESARLWKQKGRKDSIKSIEDEDPTDFVISSVTEDVFRRLSSDKFMHRLLISSPPLQQEIIRIIVGYEDKKAISRSELIRRLNNKNYTRHEVIVAYKRLKEFLSTEFKTATNSRNSSTKAVSIVLHDIKSRCSDNDRIWPDCLTYTASESEVESYYKHAEKCSYHEELVEREDESFRDFISKFIDTFIDDGAWSGLESELVKDKCLSLERDKRFPNVRQMNSDNFTHFRINNEGLSSPDSYSYRKITCGLPGDTIEYKFVLLFFGLVSIIEKRRAVLLSHRIDEIKTPTNEIHFEVFAKSQQIWTIANDFRNFTGISLIRISDEIGADWNVVVNNPGQERQIRSRDRIRRKKDIAKKRGK